MGKIRVLLNSPKVRKKKKKKKREYRLQISEFTLNLIIKLYYILGLS